MAAPPSKTLKDFSGKWTLNKSLSDSVEPVLALQGVGFLLRKTVGAASISLDVKQYQAPASPPSESKEPVTHIEIEQTAFGLSSTHEHRCLDWVFREHSDWLFGKVKGQTKWIHAKDIEDTFLAKGWEEGETEAGGPDGETHLFSHVISLDRDWTASQIWGFQVIDGQRRYARNVVVSTQAGKKAEIRLVYDFVS